LLAGAVQFTIAEVESATAATPVGAPGALLPVGVTEFDAADAGPSPPALPAVTVNVYAVPGVSPVTVVLVAGGEPVIVLAVCATPPMRGVTV
jgi:hypothetical protein